MFIHKYRGLISTNYNASLSFLHQAEKTTEGAILGFSFWPKNNSKEH